MLENVYRRYRTLRSPLCKNSPNPETLNSALVGHTFLVLPDVRAVIRGANRRFHIIRRMRQTDGSMETHAKHQLGDHQTFGAKKFTTFRH